MRRLAPVIAAAVLLTAPNAFGAPAACRLVVDPKGDDRVNGDTGSPALDDVYDDSDLDVVSADVATDARNVTTVVRTATLRESDPDSPTGRMYWFSFAVGRQTYTVAATLTVDGRYGVVYRDTQPYQEGGVAGDIGEILGSAVVRADFARSEVRVTAPLTYFARTPIGRGTRLTGLRAWTFHQYGTAGQRHQVADRVVMWGAAGYGTGVDAASSARTYVAGSASCVAVGR
jgi:hypothetical protein